MIKYKVYNQEGEAVSEIELSDKVFGVKLNQALVHQAVVAQMANARQVLAHTKDRSEVRGGGRKPWRQKGTGRARAGTIRSPIWRGGGITFGPTKDRNFSKQINKKMRKKALLMALSDKVANKDLALLDKLEVAKFKTKTFDKLVKTVEEKILKNKNKKRNILVVDKSKDVKLKKSAQNLPGVEVINLENINIVDILKYRDLLLTTDVVKELEK
ncbi:MAG: 50S ribosomal protein L4 [bacterium]